jgi:mxaJ protein
MALASAGEDARATGVFITFGGARRHEGRPGGPCDRTRAGLQPCRCHGLHHLRWRANAIKTGLLACFLALALTAQARTLRVCADPDNLPFSNRSGQGIENGLAEILARALHADLQYTWFSERRFFLRNSLNAGECDAVLGVPTSLDAVAVTKPYYRAAYAFVARPGTKIQSLDDPRLTSMRIGLNMAGEDFTPPAHALAARGLASHLVGYRIYGQPGRIVEAVQNGEIDTAIVWEPVARYFGRGLEIAPVQPAAFRGVPFTFEIGIAVRKADTALREELDQALQHECAAVHALLARFDIAGKEPASCHDASPSHSASSR